MAKEHYITTIVYLERETKNKYVYKPSDSERHPVLQSVYIDKAAVDDVEQRQKIVANKLHITIEVQE